MVKPKGIKPMNKAYTFRCSPEMLHVLDRSKWTLEMPMAEIIRNAITEYLEKHLPKNSEIRKLLNKAPEKQVLK